MNIKNPCYHSNSSKAILLTGASGHIGSKLAQSFIEQGYSIYLSSRRKPDYLKNAPQHVQWIEYDLLEYEHTPQILLDNLPVITHFIHAASPLPDRSEQFNYEFYTVNFQAFAHISKLLLPHMLQRRQGAIMAFGSYFSLFPPSQTHDRTFIEYSAAKSAMMNYSLFLYKRYQQCGLHSIYFAPSRIQGPYHDNSNSQFIIPLQRIEHIVNEWVNAPAGEPLWFLAHGKAELQKGGPSLSAYIPNSLTPINETQSIPSTKNTSALIEVFQNSFPSIKHANSEVIQAAAFEQTAGWDSLNHLKLIMNIEQHFERTIPSDDVVKLNSFCSILAYIGEKKSL
jgi:short-subunit dehydrogenase/acyl carrier protein